MCIRTAKQRTFIQNTASHKLRKKCIAHLRQRTLRRTQILLILQKKLRIPLSLPAVQMHNRIHIRKLPVRPVIMRPVNHMEVLSRINKQRLPLRRLTLRTVKEPQITRKRLRIEEIRTNRHNHIHRIRLHQTLTNSLILLRSAVRCRRRHHKPGSSPLMQIRIEIRNPQIIRIRHLPCIIHPNHTKRQTPCRLTRLSFNLIHIKRRIRHHIITPSLQTKHIMIK